MKKRILYIVLGMMLLSVKGVGQASIVYSGTSTFTYNGFAPSLNPAISFTVPDYPNYSTLAYNYVGTGTTYYPASQTAPTNVGTYTVAATMTFASSGPTSSIPFAFTIGKATPTITATGVTTYTYNGLPQGPGTSTYPADATGVVTYSYSGAASDGTVYSASGTKPTNAGSYQVVATIASDVNYNSASSSALNFTITQKPITITVNQGQSKYYGDPEPAIFTYTTSPSISGLVALVGTLLRSPGEIVGSYSILQNDLTTVNNPNYIITFVSDNFIINPAAPFFQIPNAFVPGSQNEYDNIFRIFANSSFPPSLLISFRIFNRAGQLIKTFTGINDSWDGKGPDGSLLESDVYIWVATFVDDPLTKKIPRSGTFVLLK